MPRHGVDFRLATIVLLLVLGVAVMAALATDWGAADALALPAAGLLFGGLCLAWEEVQGNGDRQG
jgi:hypothetical protein